MEAGTVETSKTQILRLEGSWTIERAGELKQVLAKALQDGEIVSIELDGLEECDLTFLQLICSAHGTSLKLNKQLWLQDNKSEPFKKVVRDGGFVRTLGCKKNPTKNCLWIGDWES